MLELRRSKINIRKYIYRIIQNKILYNKISTLLLFSIRNRLKMPQCLFSVASESLVYNCLSIQGSSRNSVAKDFIKQSLCLEDTCEEALKKIEES